VGDWQLPLAEMRNSPTLSETIGITPDSRALVTIDKELFADTLPTYLTLFVGRDREIAAVLSMVHPGRLVTVCGVGGADKTRLAIEAAKSSRARSGRDRGLRGVLGAARCGSRADGSADGGGCGNWPHRSAG
jgi:hypothetical protein